MIQRTYLMIAVAATVLAFARPALSQQYSAEHYQAKANELLRQMTPEQRTQLMADVGRMMGKVKSMTPEQQKNITNELKSLGESLMRRVGHMSPEVLGGAGMQELNTALKEAEQVINSRSR